MRIAYQGQPGAFGHEACLKFAPDHEPVPKPSFADVLSAVAGGETECGILPTKNSCAGLVPEVQELIAASKLPVLARHELPVRMHLLALPGTEMKTIRRVVSHPVALAQCARSLQALGLSPEPASNTAIAAKALAEGGDRESAVLASEAAAAIYGLTILRRDVHDQPDNATTFCILGRHLP